MKNPSSARFAAAAFSAVCLGAFAADPVEIRDRVQLSDGLYRRGMYELAAREYERLAAEKGLEGMDAVLFRLGECLRRSGKTVDAEKAYARLAAEFPASSYAMRSRLQRALIQAERGDGQSLDAAIAVFGELAKNTGAPADVAGAACYQLASSLEKRGRDKEAVAAYEDLRRRFPKSEYAQYAALRLGWLLAKTGDAADSDRAMELYLDLMYRSGDAKLAEEANYFAAQVMYMKRRYDQSANLFAQLRKKYPNSPRVADGAIYAAWANYHAGRYKEAEALAEECLKSGDKARREEALYLRANCLRQTERRADAVKAYAELEREYPDGAYASKIWYERLVTRYRDGDYTNVLKEAVARTRTPAENADAVYWLISDAALSIGRDDMAVEYSRLLSEKCPESRYAKDAMYRHAWLLQKQKAWAGAADLFLKVAEKFPKDPIASKALYSSGVCRAQLGRRDEAMRDWSRLLREYPESEEAPEALYRKAMEELRSGEYRAAGVTLDERMNRFPKAGNAAELKYWRGVVHRQLGEKSEAERMFRGALAGMPPEEIARESKLELGALLHSAGKDAEAAKFFGDLLSSSSAVKLGGERLAWLAEFQLRMKRPDEALKAAEILVASAKDDGWRQAAHALAGMAHEALGHGEAAAGQWRAALALPSKTRYAAKAALRLGEYLSKAGKYDEAAGFLERAAAVAVTPEMVSLRARAYSALGKNAQAKGDADSALRFFMSVGLLFDDAQIVPEALAKAIGILEGSGKREEAQAMRTELKRRYPEEAKKLGVEK